MAFIPLKLVLKDGTSFTGFGPAWQTAIYQGEVVFNTGMTGYVETLTDPSYAGQILTFTYPLIGNYGVPNKKYWESKKIQARGVVVSEACLNPSHQQNQTSLLNWLKEQKVPVIIGVDTRALTKHLRKAGVMLGNIKKFATTKNNFIDPNQKNLVAQVTCPRVSTYGRSRKKIIVVDCGMKENILRHLKKLPITIKRVPYNYDYSNEKFHGIFISNGPGDPTHCPETIAILKKALRQKKPTFGICLGMQIMALVAGAKTYKLPYGHRGQNQPCLETQNQHCYITSQNHGYVIKAKTLPTNWQVSWKNLNDDSIEGIKHRTLPFWGVQFHPEAAPGPTDTEWLFNKFYDSL